MMELVKSLNCQIWTIYSDHNLIRVHNGALNVWTQHYDLHSHSTNSDGEHSVEFVAGLMNDNGVKVWSLTDHDTIAGWKNGEESARALGLTFIPGVEITCERGLNPRSEELIRNKRERASRSWHLLAYFPTLAHDDKHAIEFAKWLKPLQDNRVPRMRKMVDKLAELGMPVNFEDVLAKADGSVGRPHLAEVMVEKGYVDSKFEAFEKWIGDGLPAHIAQPKPTISEAVAMVKQCGGITSLAHPLYYGIPPQELANYCIDVGIDSIEAFHRSHSDGYRFELWDTCRELGLQVSCGSDFHGQTYGQNPGKMPIPKADLCV